MYNLLIATLLTIVFFAGNKKDNSPENNKLPLAVLASEEGKKWKLVSWTAKHTENGKVVEENMFDYFNDCENDNITILFSDNIYESREGASKCNPSAKDLVEAGRWELRKNNTQIAFILNEDTQVVNIKEMNQSTIRTEYTETDPSDGIQYTITQIYQAQ